MQHEIADDLLRVWHSPAGRPLPTGWTEDEAWALCGLLQFLQAAVTPDDVYSRRALRTVGVDGASNKATAKLSDSRHQNIIFEIDSGRTSEFVALVEPAPQTLKGRA